jgi:surface antigen/peptidoglycan hydrolase CwlO-like protein
MGYAIISTRLNKIKKMPTKQFPAQFYKIRAILCAIALISLVGAAAVVHADQYDEQINALRAQNNAAQGVLNGLTTQASSYQAVINQYQAQINDIRAKIDANEAQQAALQQQIVDAQNKIAEHKKYLGEDIKAMYIDGQLSTIEELATSKNLSDYVDKEEYRITAQNKINDTIKQIAVLQGQLQKQKAELDTLVESQKQQNAQLSDAQNQQQQLLSFNEGQQSAYNAQISANSGQIAELRRQQIAANSRFIGAAGSGVACGGGYPARWCEIPQDSVIDNWGMYNRECVSYTAFRVAASGRNMPYWGGVGNANQWDDDARAAGIPVDNTPTPGSVAISNAGAYGHAMYVESVNGDGTFNLSQYNAALDGRYSTRSGVSPSGLVFIHF